MSYTKKFHERISIYYSDRGTGSCSCGKSVSCSCSGYVHEDIYTNIEVDTNPFDHSVENCNASVKTLTGAVVATEAAQLVSIDKNSRKVAGTIIDGFFGYIRSEISQQVMELSQKIDAHLLHLRELAKNCVAKQKQMETDYNRISSRYLKIFSDLNKELENRIFELNKPAFVFKSDNDKHAIRTTGNDLVSTILVSGLEGGELQAKISASVAKKRALDTINQAHIFLWKQKKLQSTINQSMLNESVTATRFSPVYFIETNGEKSQIVKNVYQAGFLPQTNSGELINKLQSQTWVAATKEQKDNIQRYFNSEVSNAYTSTNKHDERVKEMLVGIFNLDSIKMFTN
jgi:hypothetical protein